MFIVLNIKIKQQDEIQFYRSATFITYLRVNPPPFWYAVDLFRGVLGRTQYAKGQYAVRNNSVKLYAALKNSHFLNRFP